MKLGFTVFELGPCEAVDSIHVYMYDTRDEKGLPNISDIMGLVLVIYIHELYVSSFKGHQQHGRQGVEHEKHQPRIDRSSSLGTRPSSQPGKTVG